MDVTKITGGSAFPVIGQSEATTVVHQPGMTLRDYFAAKAMQGWLSTFTDMNTLFPVGDNAERLSKCAYMMADAMLKAREQ